MARVLEKEASPKGRPRHPWRKWADGRVWLLERGKDYTCPDLSMSRQAHQYAAKVGTKVTTKVHDEGVVVHFDKPATKTLPRRKK